MKVLETRKTPDGFKRRRYDAGNGQRVTTYELPAEVLERIGWAKLREAANGARWAKLRKETDERIAQMRAMRLAGQTCQAIADAFGLSLHMARYYTRLPRARVYPAAKKRLQS